MIRAGRRGRPPGSGGLSPASLLIGLVAVSVTGAPTGVQQARAQANPVTGPVEIVLDASGSMRSRMGQSDRMTAAREFVTALREALAQEGGPVPIALRAYGSASHRLRRDCTDTRLLAEIGADPEAFERALAAIQPLGVSPLAFALERAAADTAATYVLVTDGGDNCGGNACETWRTAVERRGDNRRLRLHVVAMDPEPEELERLRCISRAGSGAFIHVASPDEVQPAARRLALVLGNRGRIEARLSVAGEAFSAPVRLLRPLSGEVVTVFSGRRPRSVPAGVYTMVIETAPPIRVERVMVLPGQTFVFESAAFGRLVVELEGGRRAPLTIRSAADRSELRYVRTGEPVILGAGRFDIEVDLGDSLVVREGLRVEEGRTTRLAVGGSEPGTLRVVAPGFEDPPPVRVLAYHQAGVDTLTVGRSAEVPPGRYRLVVQSVPPYVTENVVVDAGSETTVALPETGLLGVELHDSEDVIRGVRVDVQEPMTGESYGSFASGQPTLAMPGTFRLRIRTAPLIEVDGVVVQSGERRIIERRGLSRIAVARAAQAGTPPLRLEVLSHPEGRVLVAVTGLRPSVAVLPGTYRVRVWRGEAVVWDARVVVGRENPVRIDWAGPQ